MAKERDLKLEKARVRVSTMLTLASELGTGINQAEICREPMIAPLSPVALRSAVMAANLILLAVDHLALTIAGLADDQALEALLAELVPPSALTLTPNMSPEANPLAARQAPSPIDSGAADGP